LFDVSFKERCKDSKYFAKLFKTGKKNQKSLFLAGFFSFNAVSFNSD
jgi:hypothetical protein